MPLQTDTTSNLLKGLKILQSLGEAIPAGGIIKSVAGVGIIVLETAQKVQVNKKECSAIAERAATNIIMLHSTLNADDLLSDDLRERLQSYLEVLEDVVETVRRLGTESRLRRTIKATSVQDDVQECLDKLNEAYQSYIFQFSIAADSKLSTLVAGMNTLSLQQYSHYPARIELENIPMRQIQFGEEILRIDKKAYILRIEHGDLLDSVGNRKAVILRRFESRRGMEIRSEKEFREEVHIRADVLKRQFARMLGTATSTTGRTKIIVVEDGTVVAYDYLQGLTGLDYAQEQLRIMCDLVNAYQFLLDRGGSWRGGFRDILLTAKDQRLRIGGLGSIDDNWNDSGWRMWEAFKRLTVGLDGNWRLVGSFESYKSLFSEAKNSLERWKEDAKDENAQVLLDNLWLWSPSSLFEQPTNSIPLVGQIGWMEGQEWHIIPLSVPFEVANAPAYSAIADRLCGAEWDAVEGTQLDGFTRWSVRGFPGDKINLRTWVRSTCTAQIEKFFFASALPLAEEFGLKVSSLWFVSRAGFQIDASV